jgi:hypothetical protein
MTQRYDLKSWRKSTNGKAYTVRIGSAWTDDKGTIRLAFDALPLADENNRVQAFLEVPREREQGESFGRSAPNAPIPRAQLDDDVPF